MSWALAILSYLFFVLASIANAVMDNVSHHPSLSVLKDVWGGWWVRDWRSKYNDCNGRGYGEPECGRIRWQILGFWIQAPVQLIDGWHFSKMMMVVFLALSASMATFINLELLEGLLYFVILGVSWNIAFNLFYNKILRINK